ncbi:MAG: pyridoxamine 5'-phosphate oxidase [Flavobacteriaceae bacterium]|nr:pyridoxamine 5'-phosphate oxidase [Flavobacteriaceae bacterium]MDG2504299.1 pyridoxamine 5'-phosphate oxidase [Flavobacteriaceae bacterium]
MEQEDLGHLRKSYQKGALNIDDIQNDPMTFFKNWFDQANETQTIEEANAMTLSTLGLDDFPKSRIVLLKALIEEGFVFYTNYQSEKGTSIAHHSKVGLAFFWPPLERQVIIKGEAVKLTNEASDVYFQSRPKGSQIGAIVSDQSKVISDRSIIEAKLEALEIEYAEKDVPRPEHWGGYVVKPQCIEFWQGRPNRLHDRIRCQLQGNFWNIERLAP